MWLVFHMLRYVVSGLNAMDKMPMYEMPLIFVFEVGESIFCIGVLGVGILSLVCNI